LESTGKDAVSSAQLDKQEMGFAAVAEPLIRRGLDRLHSDIELVRQSQTTPPFDVARIEELFLPNLLRPLARAMSRTMVLELNVARLQKTLEGETPEQRFQSFLKHLRQPEVASSLLREYPVLARQLVICVDDWVRFSVEFLRDLWTDWDAIRTMSM